MLGTLGAIVEQVVFNNRTLGAKSGSALGSWVVGQYYVIGDIVNYQGQLYTAIASGAGSTPSSSPGSWTLTMASLPMTTAADPALNAAVSTANIDAYSGVIITLGAAGNDQTLQDPTVTTAGRVYWVVNDDLSTDPIDIIGVAYTVALQPGESSKWIWDGSGWIHSTGVDANDIDYNPASSYLTATNVQAAFDELLISDGLVLNGNKLYLDSDNDTYLYSPSDDSFEFLLNSVIAGRWTTTGLLIDPTGVSTSPSGAFNVAGGAVNMNWNQTVSSFFSGQNHLGVSYSLDFDDTNVAPARGIKVSLSADSGSSVNVNGLTGIEVAIFNSASAVTTGTVKGFNLDIRNATDTTDSYGLYIQTGAYTAGKTVTTDYGIYIAAPYATGTVTNGYAIYSDSIEDSYFAGGMSIAGANFRSKENVADVAYNPSVLTNDYCIAYTSLTAVRNVIISSEDVASGSITSPRFFIVKDESGSAGSYNLTLTLESGGTIDGASSYVVTNNYGWIMFYVDGTNAYTIS
jgi:hypothetical protein